MTKQDRDSSGWKWFSTPDVGVNVKRKNERNESVMLSSAMCEFSFSVLCRILASPIF